MTEQIKKAIKLLKAALPEVKRAEALQAKLAAVLEPPKARKPRKAKAKEGAEEEEEEEEKK